MAARIIFTVLALVAAVFAPASSADAADAKNFDPGYIISDSEFYDWDSMTAPQVQSFLEGVNPNCVAGPDGTP